MKIFLIWSIEHDQWWGPSRVGYTKQISAAGRYTEPETAAILAVANAVEVQEAAVPLECANLSAEIEYVRDQLALFRASLLDIRVVDIRVNKRHA